MLDEDYELSPLSSLRASSPRTRSITPSASSCASSASMQSKRSRGLSSDEESGASSQKRRKEKRHAGGTKAVYMQRRSSGRSTPAEDTRFLTAEGKSARSLSRRREFIGDDSTSIRDLTTGNEDAGQGEKRKGAKSAKGKGRAL